MFSSIWNLALFVLGVVLLASLFFFMMKTIGSVPANATAGAYFPDSATSTATTTLR